MSINTNSRSGLGVSAISFDDIARAVKGVDNSTFLKLKDVHMDIRQVAEIATSLYKEKNIFECLSLIYWSFTNRNAIPVDIVLLFSFYLSEVGFMDIALDLIKEVYLHNMRCFESSPLSKTSLKIIDGDFTSVFGHIGLIEAICKMQWTGVGKQFKVCINKTQRVANKPLLDKFSCYFPYVEIPPHELYNSAFAAVKFPLSVIPLSDGRIVGLFEAALLAEQAWNKGQGGAILSFSEQEVTRGKEELRRLGIPEDAWFVGMHVRDEPRSSRNLCNADISTYLKAMMRIVDRGGYVVRIGDKRMKPLPAMKNVVDLAHSAARTSFLDIYVCGASKFFIGTSSGPLAVPPCFNVPTIYTNAFFFRSHWYSKGLRIPIMYKNKAGKMLTVDELLETPFSNTLNVTLLKQLGIMPVFNTADDICDAVDEMLDRVNDKFVEGVEYNSIQEKWINIDDKFLHKYPFKGLEKTSYKFAKKYASLLYS
jgi:putative glycosyltransferase (TIGR04372 family)